MTKKDINQKTIIIGCNYHTTWQKNSRMRFVLAEIKNDKALLKTRVSKKSFWTNISDLIFIETNYNVNKALEIFKKEKGL